HHARSDRNGDSARLLSHQLALAGVEAGTDLEAERLHVLDQRAGTLDRAARAIECGEEAVPRSVDLVAVKLIQPAADEGMMALEERTPRRVPDLGRMLRRADDVGEQHRREDAFGFLWLTDPRQEPL